MMSDDKRDLIIATVLITVGIAIICGLFVGLLTYYGCSICLCRCCGCCWTDDATNNDADAAAYIEQERRRRRSTEEEEEEEADIEVPIHHNKDEQDGCCLTSGLPRSGAQQSIYHSNFPSIYTDPVESVSPQAQASPQSGGSRYTCSPVHSSSVRLSIKMAPLHPSDAAGSAAHAEEPQRQLSSSPMLLNTNASPSGIFTNQTSDAAFLRVDPSISSQSTHLTPRGKKGEIET